MRRLISISTMIVLLAVLASTASAMTLSPQVTTGSSVTLVATFSASPQSLTFFVNGAQGGSAAVGTVQGAACPTTQTPSPIADGVHFCYAAPATVPSPAQVTITAKNAQGKTLASIVLTVVAAVVPPPPAPTASIAASPASIVLGQSTTLSWSTTNATSAALSSSDGMFAGVSVALSGSQVATPTQSGSIVYTITATGAGGTATATFGVTAQASSPPALQATNCYVDPAGAWTSTTPVSAPLVSVDGALLPVADWRGGWQSLDAGAWRWTGPMGTYDARLASSTDQTALYFSACAAAAPSSASSTATVTVQAPSSAIGVDQDGNLLVSGQPFLYVGGQKLDYFWWSAAGYSTAQADAKLGAMQAAGFNGIGEGNWGQYNGAYQDLLLWQKFGFYWLGSATLDDQGHSANGWTDAATISTIVKEFSLRPNLLRWYVAAELNPQVATTAPYDLASYQAAVSAIRAADSTHPVVGDLTVFDTNFDSFLTASADQFPLAEMTVTIPDGGGTGIDAQHIMDVIFAMQADWNRGQRFVAGLSITPIGEEDNLEPSTFVGASQASLTRALVWAVAANVKAFELLWGPNQRNYCVANPTRCVGDADQPAGVLQVWSNALAAFSQVRALQPVILAPGRFAQVITTPAFQIASSGCNNIRPIFGVYASKKQVGSTAYVIAVNVNEVGCAGAYPQGYNDTAVSGATIDVGFPITSVTRMLDASPAPSFSGSVITDDFAPMGVHVYVVR